MAGSLTKGEQTRQRILRQAAGVFNRQGYFGTSLTDIMDATGLEKGGLYNHFASKDDLALQAFDYVVDLVRQEFGAAVKGHANAVDRLTAVTKVFRRMSEGFPVEGGCPVFNTAVEADDAHPALRERARRAMDEWHTFLRRIVMRGTEKGEIRPGIDPDALATLLIATLEGAVLLSKLYGEPAPVNRAVDHLITYLETSVRQ